MFDKIQHIGYLVRDLDAAVAWYAQGFGGENAGGSALPAGGIIPSGGCNAFVHFAKVEVELIEPQDQTDLPADTLVMHHIGYAVSDIAASIASLKSKGFKFFADAPNTNVLGPAGAVLRSRRHQRYPHAPDSAAVSTKHCGPGRGVED